ncbi:PREDICTED: trichoplein keratin filament-binding protein-like [Acropora digitifera]|uniref:trichoplein keratin filament-binding protein-like n=1 Tax=Acropora digitifera TaxID=70779 RepID=UPI00077A5580|nr:PREDICTED: trichoplein keratin filament-binding protein-like [Acropora digitifera]
MALPTLQPFWLKSYKNRNEGLLVRRNQFEADRREAWEKNARYFDRSNVETTKQRVWGSRESYQESMQALDGLFRENEKQEKLNKLEKRRNKLSELLLKETKEYEAELKEKRLGGAGRLLHMKERADELKADKEARRKEIAEQKLYEHWKQNAPELREIEADQLREHVVNSWADQVVDKEENLKSARYEDRKMDAAMERERLLAQQKEQAKEEEKKREQEALAEDLREQMKELKLREEEAQMLKQEQEDLVREQHKLEEAADARRHLEEARRKREFGRVLIRQHKAQMKRKSKEIQESLELDLKILSALAQKKDESKALETSRREKARADAEYMRQVVADQLRLEQQREAELDMLYRDEAARMWAKREAEWERERLARERLMTEVLNVRQRQLDEKMEDNRRRQQESIESREELLRELEQVQQLTAREKAEEERKRREREEEMQAQITSRREKAKEQEQLKREEMERERRERHAYNQMLSKEADFMRARGPQARFAPRRRTAFE